MSDQKKREYPGVMLYIEDMETWSEFLTDEETGKLFKALTRYARHGEEPENLPRHLEILFDQARRKIIRDREKYDQTCERRSNAAKRREAEKKAKREAQKEKPQPEKPQQEEATTGEAPADHRQEGPKPVIRSKAREEQEQVISNLLAYWKQIYKHEPTGYEIEGITSIVRHGYKQSEVEQAIEEAEKNADKNPIGYMHTILKAWRRDGRPKREYMDDDDDLFLLDGEEEKAQ